MFQNLFKTCFKTRKKDENNVFFTCFEMCVFLCKKHGFFVFQKCDKRWIWNMKKRVLKHEKKVFFSGFKSDIFSV